MHQIILYTFLFLNTRKHFYWNLSKLKSNQKEGGSRSAVQKVGV